MFRVQHPSSFHLALKQSTLLLFSLFLLIGNALIGNALSQGESPVSELPQAELPEAKLPSSILPGIQTQAAPVLAVVYVGVDPERPYRRHQSWVPLTVELTNQQEAIKGFLVVRMKNGSVSYSVPVNLPTKAKKNYDLTVFFPQLLDELEFYIQVGRKETRIETITVPTAYSETDRFMIVISEERGSHDFFAHRPEEEEVGLYRRVFYSIPELLPRYSIGYQNLDVILWDGGPTTSLTPEQSSALESWIQMGGTLILAAGDHWQELNNSSFRLYIPLTLTGSRVLEAGTQLENPIDSERPILQTGTVITTGELLNDPSIRVWLKADTDPFLVERKWGAGRIVFVASSINKPLFTSPLHQTILKDFLTRSYLPQNSRVVENLDNHIIGFLLNKIQAELPGTWFIALYLGIYIILVVPVNYLVFRLLGRLEWAWFTVPIWAILFAYGAYYIGALRQQGQVTVNQVSIVEARSNANAAFSTTYSSIYSPVFNTYTLQFKDPVSFPQQLNTSGNRRSDLINRDLLEIQYNNESSQVNNYLIHHWSQETLKSQHEAKLGKGIAIDLQWISNHIIGSVTNRSGITLQTPTVFIRNKRIDLPSINDGETISVDQNIDTTLPGRVPDNNYQAYLQDKQFASFVQNGLNIAYANEFFSQYPTMEMAVLTAYLDQSQLQFLINNEPAIPKEGQTLLCEVFPLQENKQGRILIQKEFWSFTNTGINPGNGSQFIPVNQSQFGGYGYGRGGMQPDMSQRMSAFQISTDSRGQWDFHCDTSFGNGRIEMLTIDVDYTKLGFVQSSMPSGQEAPYDLVQGRPRSSEYEVEIEDVYRRNTYYPLSQILDDQGNIKNPGRFLDKGNSNISCRIKTPPNRLINVNTEAFNVRLMINYGTEAGGKFLGTFIDSIEDGSSSVSPRNRINPMDSASQIDSASPVENGTSSDSDLNMDNSH